MEFNNIIGYAENTVSAELLISWGFECLVEEFSAKGIDVEVFKCMTCEDIDKLFPEDYRFGLKVKFRQQLYKWRQENGYLTPLASTKSLESSYVENWLSSIESTPSTSSQNTSFGTENKHLEVNKLEFLKILNSCTSGIEVLKYYEDNKYLRNIERKTIVNLICEFWLHNKIRPNKNICLEAASQIINTFPTENKDIYIGSNKVRGKLLCKYYTLTNKYKTGEKFTSETETEANDNNVTDNEEENPPEENEHFVWLKYNKTPANLVIEKWNYTFSLRRKLLKKETNIFDQWPILKQRIGATLIELDFEKLYPQKNLLLFNKWEIFEKKILQIYKKEFTDPKRQNLLQKLNGNISPDSRAFLILNLLNYILVPHLIKEKVTTTKKRIWRPTIVDGQHAFAFLVEDVKCITVEIQQRKEKCIKNSLTLQPVIVLVGENIEKIQQIFLYFDEVLYDVENFLKAVSLSFQLHYVLNIHFAKECYQIWNFIENYFYEFPVSNEKTTALSALLSSLKNN